MQPVKGVEEESGLDEPEIIKPIQKSKLSPINEEKSKTEIPLGENQLGISVIPNESPPHMREVDEVLAQLEEPEEEKAEKEQVEEEQVEEDKETPVEEEEKAAEEQDKYSIPHRKNENVIIIENKDLKYSPSSNTDEYELNYDGEKQNKILLKFPKKMDKIRLNIREQEASRPNIPSNRNKLKNIDERIPQSSINRIGETINPKLNEFIHKKYETPLPNTQHIKIEELKVKKQIDELKNMDCIKTKYLSEYWKRYFPKNTAMFTFNPKLPYCNYNLIIMILKDFNGKFFKDITYEDVKLMLIKYYEQYFDSTNLVETLYVKWIREKKSKYIDKLKSGELTLEQIIMDENYRLTESDILIISYILNIPIVILYQSKNQIKTASFVKQNKFSYRYYIKASNLNVMYLYSYKNLLKIKNDNLSTKLFSNIQSQSFDNYESYIVQRIRKIKKKETE